MERREYVDKRVKEILEQEKDRIVEYLVGSGDILTFSPVSWRHTNSRDAKAYDILNNNAKDILEFTEDADFVLNCPAFPLPVPDGEVLVFHQFTEIAIDLQDEIESAMVALGVSKDEAVEVVDDFVHFDNQDDEYGYFNMDYAFLTLKTEAVERIAKELSV